jgi:DNA-binding response OmpR family regulator
VKFREAIAGYHRTGAHVNPHLTASTSNRNVERAPDLIILDLNVPVVGGVELCRILRSRADVPHVPIIMLTARTSGGRSCGRPRPWCRRLRDEAVQHPRAVRPRPRCAATRGERGQLRTAGRQIETVIGLGYRFID